MRMKMKSTGLAADLNLVERNVLKALTDNSSVTGIPVTSEEGVLESNLADTNHYTAKRRKLDLLNVNFNSQQPHWNLDYEE